MQASTCVSAPIPLVRPWPQRFADDFWRWLRPAAGFTKSTQPVVLSEADYAELAGLSESTLRDIGAPDWVHERSRPDSLWLLERARW